MRGYFRDLQATRSVVTADGWLDTGDMGYLIDGGLVITGRSKDLIIFNGRNIWPQDLEWAIERLEGVRPGDVAAFAVNEEDDRERVVVVVECRSTNPMERQAAPSRCQGDGAEGCERRVRGRARPIGIAHLHHLGQAQSSGRQGKLPEWRDQRRRVAAGGRKRRWRSSRSRVDPSDSLRLFARPPMTTLCP